MRAWTTVVVATGAALALVGAFVAASGGRTSDVRTPERVADSESTQVGSGARSSPEPAPSSAKAEAQETDMSPDESASPASTAARDDDALPGDPIAELDAADPFRRLRAAEALAKAGRVDALPQLQAMDLRGNGYLASTVVRSIGHLATMASPAARDGAAKHLGEFLSSEVSRRGQDRAALGNAIATIDALADSGSAEAIGALVAQLDAGVLPLAARTKVVEALSALEARSATAAIERFERHVSSLPPSEDAFEQELRGEATAAAREALTHLSTST